MTKLLSQEEIDTLLTNVSPEQDQPLRESSDGRRVVPYDFKHPSLISKEQLRLLEHVHEGLVRNFGVYLSTQLRMIVDMSLLTIDQIMYSEFVMAITPPSGIFIANISGPHAYLVLEISPQLAVFIVERTFGGQGTFESSLRSLSLIEQRIMKRVVSKMASEICRNWQPIHEFDCHFSRFESSPEFVQVVPASEPVVVVSTEINIHGNNSMINICYPYMWISTVMSHPELQEKVLFGTPDTTRDEQVRVKSNLDSTPVPISARLGKSRITIRDFINMNVGDVIRLDSGLNDLCMVYARKQRLYSANIGRRGKKYALRIQDVINGDNDGIT